MENLISIKDLSKEEILYLLESAKKIKKDRKNFKDQVLKGKTVALIFTKPSNRTRVSFEVGIVELGGYPLYLGPQEIRLGEREAIKDAARVLARYVDGIVIRTFDHNDIVELAKYADIPVINGLSDLSHPCQILADILTIDEKIGLKDKKIVYVGDGNNIVNSWLYASAKLGLHFVVSTPANYKSDKNIFSEALDMGKKSGAKIEYVVDPKEAVKDADVIYTDVWVSMGQEKESESKKKMFKPYQVNKKLTSLAKKDFLFMHCLPAHRGEEVVDEVLDGENSVVIDEAENRLHIQKAVMVELFKI